MMGRRLKNPFSSNERAVTRNDTIARFFHIVNPTSNSHFSTTMSSPKRPLPPIERPPRKPRKCHRCGEIGHDRRNCPVATRDVAVGVVAEPAGVNQNAVADLDSNLPLDPPTTRDASLIDWNKVLYVIFDLETTGRSRYNSEIIELAAILWYHSGVQLEDDIFVEFVKPKSKIPTHITTITSITDDEVKDARPFSQVADAFVCNTRQESHVAIHTNNYGDLLFI
jgi:Exonuclease